MSGSGAAERDPDGAGERGRTLVALARETVVAAVLATLERDDWDQPFLHRHGAAFVTLRRSDALRGCIGTLEAYRPLGEDVRANARAAALRDPRFPPLGAGELDGLSIEVSELSPSEPMPFASEADARAQLRPGVDGVVLGWSGRHGTFLPQVWDQLPDPADFLDRLKVKAGLPADFWHPDLVLRRYTVRTWR